MAFKNMKAEIRREGITQRQIAESMEMSENNFSLKVNERIPMTVDEAKFIQRTYFDGNTLDYLLESDGDVPSARERAHAAIDMSVDELNREGALDDEYRAIADELHEFVDADERYITESLKSPPRAKRRK